MFHAKPLPLSKVFVEQPEYAWDLLEQEIEVETYAEIDGKSIAKLLSLYMRGVEKLNSLQDKREQFFQVRMTNLMMKPNVVKILSSPVKGKEKEKQKEGDKIKEGQNEKNKEKERNKNRNKNNDKDKQQDIEDHNLYKNDYSNKISIDYIQRTKEMQMQIQYSLTSSTQNLNKMLSQHHSKSQTVLNKINQIKQEGHNRLEQRIKEKQRKAEIARSQSENKINYNSNKKLGEIGDSSGNLNVIMEEPRSRKGSKCVKRKYSLEIGKMDRDKERREQDKKEEMKPRRKFTQSFGDVSVDRS